MATQVVPFVLGFHHAQFFGFRIGANGIIPNRYPSRFGIHVDDDFSWIHDKKLWVPHLDHAPGRLVALTQLNNSPQGVT